MEEMVDVLDQFFRSYDLRLTIAGDKAAVAGDDEDVQVERPD